MKNSFFCGMLMTPSLIWTLRLEYEMFRMRAMATKIFPSPHSKILDYCFIISNGNVPYEPLKYIHGFSDKLGCSGKHYLPWNPTKRSPNMALF